MAAASSVSNSPPPSPPESWPCRTPGCPVTVYDVRHRHCCSLCRERGLHTEDCARRVARLGAASASGLLAQRAGQFCLNCPRRVSSMRLYCCRICDRRPGRGHTRGCNKRAAAFEGTREMPATPSTDLATAQSSSAAGSASPTAGPTSSDVFEASCASDPKGAVSFETTPKDLDLDSLD